MCIRDRPRAERLNHVPLISWQEAIAWPKHKKGASYPTITTEYRYSDNAFALMVEEDDWENLAKDTALLVDPALEAEHRDFVIIYKQGQKIPTLKQVLIDEEKMYLKPSIQGYTITLFSLEHRILGIVVEYKKHLRKLAAED